MSRNTDRDDRLDTPFLVERLMREARRQVEDVEFKCETEFLERLPQLIDNGLPALRLKTLKNNLEELAQEFAFEAYESGNGDIALELVDKALLVDPDCVDALTVRAALTTKNPLELVTALENAVLCGEKKLGEKFFAEFKGDFWPMVEARPYMRTIKQLAEIQWSLGRRFDAVAQYEKLIDLDPDDHLGNSTLLMGHYLGMGEVHRSLDLLETIDDESGAVFNWARVLLLLMTGDEGAARDAVDHAMAANPHVAFMLVGMGQDSSEELSPYIKTGSEEEALFCVQVLGEAWERSGFAQMWLYRLMGDLGLVERLDGEIGDGGAGVH